MIGQLVITDTTTREELIARVNDLDEEIQRLKAKIRKQKLEIEDLSLAPEQQERLEESAGLMAELGRIHNTLHAKQQWVNGY